ncbi:lysophospholipid acyltransferase family protein [Planktosalinus lacus]|nr:lysophospholipid acyltransferase family protein [Planktosalinus lacus]
MQLLAYIIFYPLLWFISILPFRLLYVLSDFIYILIYHIIGYRKKTVRSNIALVLPHLSKKERLSIEKKSYKHLCDMFLEMIKTMNLSQKEIERRFTFSNLDVYLDLEKKGKSIAVLIAHYASYEWVISMNRVISFDGFAIYKKLRNPYFDKLIKDIRSKFKAYLINTKETIDVMKKNDEEGRLCVYGFASDQSPKAAKAYHWAPFMGHKVPIHTGAEMLSKRFDMNVIYLKVKKIKRGFYEATFEVLSEDVRSVPDYQISDMFIKRVEEQIRESPEFYLWTHKRWKHKKD